jgi:hypothetical protein
MYACIYTLERDAVPIILHSMFVCMYVCMYVCAYVCICMYAYIHTYVRICIHTYACACSEPRLERDAVPMILQSMFVCMYVCVYIYTRERHCAYGSALNVFMYVCV